MTAALIPEGPLANVRAAKVVQAGGLLIYPTDTVYGLGCDPTNSAALGRLFAAKGRGAKAVPVLCASLAEAEDLVVLGPRAMQLAREHWPGALTIVAPIARNLPEALHQGSRMLGVRVPGSASCIALIEACGGILVGTSANLSGRPSSRTPMDAVGQLGSLVDLVIDGGRLDAPESTVVKVSGDNIIILRKGAVGVSDREEMA